ncbi:unnamed protein product [Caenorhabditis angaria]|uniref:Uncharacterized protein n=1 Tax=Caenorhabditis angaria TaxID=860376 RepID=A0A9P1MWY2_9PELO|nr:unnamed protein product [Caenorhabditis angaria]
MNILTKIRFSQCSKDCYEEVGLSPNYVEIVEIHDGREDRNREIILFVVTKDEEWEIQFYKPPSGNCRVQMFMNESVCTWVKQLGRKNIIKVVLKYFNDILKNKTNSVTSIGIFIDDFPYHRSNIRNLNAKTMEEIDLSMNYHGITPNLGEFVDLAQLFRVQKRVGIANLPLNDLFKIKAKRTVLKKPHFSLDEFDNFLRRALIEEALDENVERIQWNVMDFEIYRKNVKNIRKMIAKYMELEEIKYKEPGVLKHVVYERESEKWENRKYHLAMNKYYIVFVLE